MAPERSPALRWPATVVALVLALVGGFALGRMTGAPAGGSASGGSAAGGSAAGGDVAAGDDGHSHGSASDAVGHSHDYGAGSAGSAAAGSAGGLAISDAGLRLAPEQTVFAAGREQSLRFKILDSRSRPVTDFAVVHERPLHLIVVRRDLSGFQHLHPEMAGDGTWSIPLTLPSAGAWRAYADFTATVDGKPGAAVLGMDLSVTGDFRPRPLPAAEPRAAVGGYEVAYEGTPRVGAVQPLLFRVTKGGAPAAVEPYLGAYGHLVVVREGDLGYLHVHPDAAPVGAAVKFWLAAPSAGRYRMFFDFKVAGQVHTAEFTLPVPS